MVKDKDGNEYYFDSQGVFVRTLAEKRLRKIFAISGNALTKQIGLKHKMQDGNIGFSYEALKYINLRTKIQNIYVYLGREIYKTTIKDVISLGHFLYFKGQGYEKQIFYNTKDMEKVK